MFSFRLKKISSDCDRLAESLKQARLGRGLKIEKAAQKTQINIKYLLAIEKGAFSELPEGVYRKTFIKEYAQFLNVDAGYFFEKSDNYLQKDRAGSDKLFAECKEKQTKLIVLPKLFKNLAVAFIILICFVYLQNKFSNVISAPALAVENPPESFVTDKRSIMIQGSTEPESQITINGRQVLSGPEGSFEEQINLRTGMNTITIIAKKKHGQEKTIVKQVLVKDKL
jgi:cytoskeletal protein RodZ